jgi:carboxypeptidase Taq
MPRTPQQAYAELIRREKEASVLGSCASLLSWDEHVYMPKGGAGHRAEQMALLARMTHELTTDPVRGELLGELESSSLVREPTSAEAVNIREMRRTYDRAVKIPKTLVEELARATTLSQQAWAEARAKSDFKLFQPHLQKIVGLKRQEAEAVGYRKTPYDALLDEFEPGAETEQIERTFQALRQELVSLIAGIVGSGKRPRTEILHRDYPVPRQEIFGQAAAAAIGFDFQTGRLDVTVHPFCSGIGPGDVRLCTRYNSRNFNEAFFGTLHEAGHGIYEQGLDPEHAGTPMGRACSMGIHESQSRTWENLVGRSRAFWEHWFPRARQVFPNSLADVSLDDWMFAVNDVQASFIRVEADEATYNLHIILRFELEQALISGDLPPADVPGVWNENFQRYFQLTPPDDAQGCLQDIHWSIGFYGYFPTYALGNLYAAQFRDAAWRDLGDLSDSFRRGDYAPLKQWLNEKIHRQGQRWRAPELCRQITGQPLSHEPLMRYLRRKYEPLYGL